MQMIIQILVMFIMLIASISDIKKKEIPVFLLGGTGAFAFLNMLLAMASGSFAAEDVMSLMPGALMILISFISRGELGLADGIMVMSLGPVLGLNRALLGLMAALFLSCIFSIGILALKKGNKKTRLPFIPFLTAGTGVAFICVNCLAI